MNYHRRFILLFFCLVFSVSFSQKYTHFTTKDGLPSNHIYRITQDYDGFIWFITDKGMAKYNGHKFKVFTTQDGLPTNGIWDIRITPDNKVWFFSKADKLGYIYKDQIFTFNGSNDNQVFYPIVINQSKNDISFSNSIGSYVFKKDKWDYKKLNSKNSYVEYVLHKKISRIIQDSVGAPLKIVNNQNKVLKENIPLELFRGDNYRGQVNDSLFCWVNNKGYAFLNLNSLNITTYTFEENNLPSESQFVRFNSANARIQISGLNFILILDNKLKIKESVLISPKLKSHFSFIDKEGNIWSATFNSGVFFQPKVRRNISYQLVNEKVGNLYFMGNNLVSGVYDKGFYKYDKKAKLFSEYVPMNGFMFAASSLRDSGVNYYMSNRAILRVKHKKKKWYNFVPNPNETARKIVRVNAKLYGTFSFGINQLEENSLKVVKTYYNSGVSNIMGFKNKLLIATAQGLSVLEQDSIKPILLNNRVWNKPVTSFYPIDENQIVVCTNGFGAYISDLKNIHLLEKSSFLSVQNAFVKDKQIWLATNKGVLVYEKSDLSASYLFKTKYTSDDGLISDNTTGVAVVNHDLIVSSNNGIVIIPVENKKHTSNCKMYIDKVQYNTKSIKENDTMVYQKDNHIIINVSSIDFSEKSTLNYKYKLLPVHNQWTVSKSNQIVFNNLPPNKYQFIIQSATDNKSFNFYLQPNWYQTLAAKIGLRVLVLGLLATIVLLYRKKELSKKTKKLETQKKLAEFKLYALRSQMNPHFVFNSLNAIQYYLNDNKIDLSEKYLVKFAKLIRMFFDFSQQTEIAIAEEIRLLEAYLEIEKLRFGKDFKYQVHKDKTLDSETLIPAMLLQPIVENAVNHGLFHKKGKGHIQVSFKKLSEKSFQVIIEDDGIGRIKSQELYQRSTRKHQSKSSKIITERIRLLNQSDSWNITYKIQDLNKEKQSGTQVIIKFNKP